MAIGKSSLVCVIQSKSELKGKGIKGETLEPALLASFAARLGWYTGYPLTAWIVFFVLTSYN